MASKLTLLKCPQCGSNHVEAAGDDRFQCKSCKSFFMYDSNRIYNITNNTYYNAAPFTQSSLQKKAMMALSIFSTLFVGSIALFYLIRPGNSNIASFSIAEEEKQEIEAATAVLSANGPQVWKLVNITSGMDKNRYVLIKEDAATRKEVKRDTLSGVMGWTAYRESPYHGADLFSYGAYCFLIYDAKSKIKAFHTDNGQLAWDEKTFPQRFPEFKTAIVEINEGSARYRQFTIRAANGLTYHYFADADTVISRESFEKAGYQHAYHHALKDTTYFSFAKQVTDEGKYSVLYRVRRTASLKDPHNGYFFEYDYAGQLKVPYYREQARILDYAPITPDIHFFNPYIVYQNGKSVVIAYQADANEKGPLLISLIQADGTVSFTAGGKDTEPIKEMLRHYREALYYRDRLFFYEQGNDINIAILNLQTGKLDLQYKQDRK